MSEESSESAAGSLKSIVLDGLGAKAKDPLISAFVVSFLVVNWDLLFIAFGPGLDIPERIETFRKTLETGMAGRFLEPVLATAFYVWMWPWLTRRPMKLAARLQVARENVDIEARKDLFDIKAELDAFMNQLAAEKKRNDELNQELGVARDKLNSSEAERKKLEASNAQLLSHINDRQTAKPESKTTEPSELDKLEKATRLRAMAQKLDTPIEFNHPITHFANKEQISNQEAMTLYYLALRANLDFLKAKYSHSNSIRDAGEILTSTTTGDRSAVERMLRHLSDFNTASTLEAAHKSSVSMAIKVASRISEFLK